MDRSEIDTSLPRVEVHGFTFPLGVFPVEALQPKPGYVVQFEPADGGTDDNEWEEWPDRYMFDVVCPASRMRALCRALFALLPERVYPILDLLGHDAYREVDPYIAYEPVGFDRFISGVCRHAGWLFEDGLVGFGAMIDEPFLYIYLDEHKIATVRVGVEMRDRVERTLAAFDLEETDATQGADAAAHEHRGVLLAPPDRPELMAEEQILEELRQSWRLQFNVDRFTNLDDEGNDLGVTCWRCVVRAPGSDDNRPAREIEVLLTAGSLDEAERMALNGLADDDADDAADVLIADRVTPEEFRRMLGAARDAPSSEESPRSRVYASRPLSA